MKEKGKNNSGNNNNKKNPVAKNIRKFNKPAVMKDRKKEMKKTGEQYHDKP